MVQTIGLIAAITLPLWNIPLIVRVIKRRTSDDISLYWALGVWFSLVAMAPSGFASADIVWKAFNIVNSILFSCVLVVVLVFRKKAASKRKNLAAVLDLDPHAPKT